MVGFERQSKVTFTEKDYITAGAVSGLITRQLFQPLDVLKIRFQLQIEPISGSSVVSKYKGLNHAYKCILKEEGIQALWKGTVPAQFLSVTYGALQFLAFELLTEQAKNVLPVKVLTDAKPAVNFTCGALAGCVATVGSFPFDVVRTRLVGQGEPKTYGSIYQAVQLMVKNEGLLSFYKGLSPTLLQIAPQAGAQFAFYRIFQGMWDSVFSRSSAETTTFQNGVCGAGSGMAAKVLIYPLDLMKKRYQIQGFEEARKSFGAVRHYRSLVHCVRSIFLEEGVFGLYKGVWPSIIKAAFTTGGHFLFYEETLRVLAYFYSQ
ncbi:mitochondrial thiamine pyrophosphate carrier-like [Uloborus diversus]|uniref:mitochondrial thiamine pyrophosphate carrier-like n=1 Tax=Uloborus diversus TaxID=327109 RepID=UPI00240A542A|nr:mitochondrial thiamine pyrophosphate carrier-like [Uloborus diversus]XP_054714695.1 mitochondrial thiamine pyrophosphate carrier-like [Uloborus diversus]XP_054714696.1 mitochondrial thiamine pyrophosphate carrier-like [Uloborus diversus]